MSLKQGHLIHIVQGDSAAGCLQAACNSHGLPGMVINFSDTLAHGPLSDGTQRKAYLRSICAVEDNDRRQAIEPFAQWHSLLECLDVWQSQGVVVWTGNNVADAIFVAMTCHRLAGRSNLPLLQVRVPPIEGRSFVAMHSPAQIAQLFTTRQFLSALDRQALAEEFMRICDTCNPVRNLVQGRVVGVPMDHYDPLLFDAVGRDWRTIGSVVGTAMARCDDANLLDDGFFYARLEHLLKARQIEADSPLAALRETLIRRTQRAFAD